MGAGLAWLHRCGVSVCLFRRLTGVPCLTCGATRAFAALLAGDWTGALNLQPLAVVGSAGLGAACAVYAGFFFLRRRVVCVRFERSERRVFCVAVMVLAVLNWLYLVRGGV